MAGTGNENVQKMKILVRSKEAEALVISNGDGHDHKEVKIPKHNLLLPW
jgi:hypothetical protein